jgi:flagellar hook-associated protein 3 FlgL
MVASRVSTLSVHKSLITDYTRVNDDLTTLQRQISSGKIARTFQDLDGTVERVNILENKLKGIQQNIDSNTVVITRLNTMTRAVGDIIRVSDEIQSLIVLAQSATQAQYPIFAQDMENKLGQIASLLNTNTGGRYLFSGSKTDQAPVIDPPPPNVGFGVPDDGYYQGDNETLTARVNENFLLDYGVRANDPAFQKLIAGALTAIDGLRSGNQSAISQAQQLALEAGDEVNAVRSSIELNIVTLNDANDLLDSILTTVRGDYGKLTGTDLVAASTEMAVNEGILQATFATFSRVSGLRLSDYLR